MDQADIIQKYKLKELADFSDRIVTKLQSALKNGDECENADFRNYLLYTIGKSIVTCNEIIVLCSSGYPDGALSLSRNLYEQFIITSYLYEQVLEKKDTSIMERYNDDYHCQRAYYLLFYANRIGRPNDEIRTYKNQIKQLKRKHQKSLDNYWWTNEEKKSFGAICEAVEADNKEIEPFLITMRMLYKRACLSLHASSMGNMIRLGSDTSAIDLGPWNTGQECALFLAAASMVYITELTFDILGTDYADEKNIINDFAIYYQSLMQKTIQQGTSNLE